MKAWKKIVAAAAAGVCAISMAACGSGSSGEATDLTYDKIELGTTGKDIKTTINLFSQRTDMLQDSYNGTTWAQYIKEFNKLYPNITVKVEGGTNYGDAALTRLQGGDWGDMMMIPTVDASELQNYFLPFGTVDNLKDEVHYVYAQQYDGNVYGISSTGNAVGIVYNKKVFKDAGITELPKTSDELISDLKLIKDKTDATPL